MLFPIVGDSYDSNVHSCRGRIDYHCRESLISGELQWKSRLGDKQTSKRTPDRPRRVYFLFTHVITRRRNSPIIVDRLGCSFPNDFGSSDVEATSGMFTVVVKIPDYRGCARTEEC